TASACATDGVRAYYQLRTHRWKGGSEHAPNLLMRSVLSSGLHAVLRRYRVKRIRNNPIVQIAPSTHAGRPCGPGIQSTPRILPIAEQHTAEQLMDRKYGWLKRMFALIWRLQGREQVYIEITPTQP